MLDACKEVGPALFFSLLIITVSFLPVFTLESQEGRLFSPLAYTKTFSMAGAALLSVTLVPVLMMLFIRGKIMPEAKNPLNRFLIWVYRPIIAWVMRWKKLTIALAVIAMGVSYYPASKLGSEFMPTLNEGTLLYMPASLPGMSITKAAEVLQTQDKIIKSFPEVASVYGKAGRANTATDPAPTEMFETVINLKPQEEWRPGMTTDKLIAEMDKALQFPGVSNAWTMPIKARIDMLSTGIRTPIGIKVFGKDLGEMEKLAKEIEAVVKTVPGTTSAFAERLTGGSYLNIEPDREALARYGLSVGELLDVIGTRSAARWSPPPSKGASASASRCATRASCAPTRSRSSARCWCPSWAARWCRWGRWPRWWWRAARRASAPRTRCCRPTSSSTSATATSAPTSPTPARRWPIR
jgi:Cu(I)/Ag(I) efflux system membrane protein CusA/SilA